MPLILPFAGLGVGATWHGTMGTTPLRTHGRGGGGLFDTSIATILAGAAAFVIGAAATVTALGRGGLTQTGGAGAAGLVAIGSSGIGVSSSLSNMNVVALV